MSKQIVKRIRGRKLQNMRQRHFTEFPLCVACHARGRVTLAQELDHIEPLHLGGTNEPDNLQGLCIPCHQIKTARENGTRVHASFYPEWLEAAGCELTIVFGPPASGKTSYVAQRAKPNDIVIDLDVIISEVSGEPMYQASSEWLAAGVRVRNAMLGSLKNASGAAWFIATGQGANTREWWADRLKPAHVVVLAEKADVCIARIRSDQRRANVAARQIKAVRDWWSAETGHNAEVRVKGCGIDGW